MDDSWRFRPSIHPSLCPICSTSHFPFCPPPPSFDRHANYLPDPLRRYDIPPPFHRPFPDHRPPPPIQTSRDPDPWSASPAFLPSSRYEFPEREIFSKRMRIEDFPPPSVNFSDDERRLSLIRSHGQQISATAFDDQYRRIERSTNEFGVRGQHVAMDRNFDRPAVRNDHEPPPEPVFSHQSLLAPENPYDGYRGSQQVDRFAPQERRHLSDASRSGGPFSSPHFGEHLAHRYDTPPQMPQGYRHGDPVKSLDNYASRDPQEYRHGDRVPHGYRYGDPDESLENYAARAPQSYRLGDPVENLENYASRAPQGYRHGGTDESLENFAGRAPQGYRHGGTDESLENFAGRAPQSYRHGDPIGSSENYAVNAPEERPLHGSRPPMDFYPASDSAPQGTFQKYYGPDHQQLYMNENPPFLLPRPPQYPRIDDGWVPLNVVNQGQEINHMFHDTRPSIDSRHDPQRQQGEATQIPIREDSHKPFDSHSHSVAEQSSGTVTSKQVGYLSVPSQMHNPEIYPPLPPEPLPEVHPEPPTSLFPVAPPLPTEPPVPSPAQTISQATMSLPPNAYPSSGTNSSQQSDLSREPPMHASTGFANEGFPLIRQAPSKQYPDDGGQTFPLKHAFTDISTVVDASHLFKQPYRSSRPDHFVIILRGLPGSGKSYLAKALRDIEVENGGNAPRIHAMDDYFMMEVEKVEDNDGSKLSRGRKQIMKKVIEYCYEPEMEEAYRSSMLKAFKKTLDEGIFTFIIVDDRNLRVADFAQFWAIAKSSGYEVYILEATYKDPAGCAARNVHNFTLDDIHKMAEKWEVAPSLYLQLDIQSLFHGDNLNEHSIKEVDMDTDDATFDGDDKHHMQDVEGRKTSGQKSLDYALDNVGDRWHTEEEEEMTGVKELHKSKWSKDLDGDIDNPDDVEKNPNALSGLMQAYGKTEKSVHWGDKVDKRGFSIGALKKSISSLVIGPGSGYNLNSNPLPEDMETTWRSNVNDSKRRFHEQLCAEHESFKAVFDKRRHRIGGVLNTEDE